MKNEILWVKTILSVYRYLERIANAIDKIVKKSALASGAITRENYYYNNVFSISQKIIDLSDRKVTLINLKVLTEDVLKSIDKSDAKILIERYIDGLKCRQICENENISMRTVFRKLENAEISFAKNLKMRGYCESKIASFLKNEKWINNVYLKMSEKDENINFSNSYIEKVASA